MSSASIRIEREWDHSRLQTVDLEPAQGFLALIRYELDPWPDEGGLPPSIASALAGCLTEHGIVAGRWFDSARVPAEAVLWPVATQNFVRRAVERIRNSWPAPVVTTRAVPVVVELLDQGWDMQFQALLLLRKDGPADHSEAVRALSITRDWREFDFPEPVSALIAPGVDGDVILVATVTAADLDSLLSSLAGAFRAHGCTVID